ncbi:hypothetical protein CEY00_Acc29409 [Actinidia chinensis var. chinensis]|uniref:Bifunctional inhibitor/plant lipid transfer protein/seed storage helical domain-containing protein n=1 Tax=Actinidia chinensis var. chinensis TaxID=1590841 RepID=A0A2R6PCU1_ACTCC|nr:hypothetical protein CEY00_Acc29409 [Actinidia chinensis var. chinensis]
MASPHPLSITATTFLTLLSLTLSQTPGGMSPAIAECGTSLLPLAPCAPFVQGRAAVPPQPCCGGLHQLYHQQPNCICLLLNDSTLSSFPINTTLALQLPLLCNLQLDRSTCSGVPLPPSSPASQVSFGTTTNSNSAASPTVTLGPRSTIIGFGQSGGARLNMESHLVVTAAAAILCTKLLSH